MPNRPSAGCPSTGRLGTVAGALYSSVTWRQREGSMVKVASASAFAFVVSFVSFALAAATGGAALADGMDYPTYYHHDYLPPERHVIEVVQPPWSGNFIINGARFSGVSPACLTWAAGERIRLIEGDWN